MSKIELKWKLRDIESKNRERKIRKMKIKSDTYICNYFSYWASLTTLSGYLLILKSYLKYISKYLLINYYSYKLKKLL